MGRTAVVLVTGASGDLGARVSGVLRDEPGVSRVVRVADPAAAHMPADEPPGGDGHEDLVQLDVSGAQIGALLDATGADTVVHLGLLAHPSRVGGRGAMKEANVVGAIQLLSACQRSRTVRKVIIQSTSAVYGIAARNPAVFTEEFEPRASRGYGRDALDVEGYVRSLARRRPDIAISALRFVNLIGPGVDSALARYFSMPVPMTAIGYDPRIQFVHVTDATEVVRRMVAEDHPGTFNVTGRGVMLVTQCLRRAGRVPVPVPSEGLRVAADALHVWRLPDFSRDQLDLLRYGQVVDGSKLEHELGWQPAYTTAEAFADFMADRGLRPGPASEILGRALDLIATAAGGRPW
jgi:UDP-glucose 4-epimerase